MRRCFALLALVVTTWSNVAVVRCPPAIAHSSGREAAGEHHGHTGHVNIHHGAPDSDERTESHPTGQECGVVMACGTALGGHGAVTDRSLLATFAEIPHTAVAAPSAADLTQDPPPPRRHA